MLNKLREKKTAKKIWITLAILILPAFVLWGSGSLIRSSKDKASKGVMLYGKRISGQDLQDSLHAVRIQALMMFGDNFAEMEQVLNLESQAIDRLILLKEARRHKMTASDQEVIDFIKKLPFFQNKGAFDRRAYEYMMSYVFRTQSRVFEEYMRQNLLIEKLYETLTARITLSESDVKEAYKRENEQISVTYIASLYSDCASSATVTDEEIQDYYATHSLMFKQPVTYNLEFVSSESPDGLIGLKERLDKKEDFAKAAGELNLAVKETGFFPQSGPIPVIGWVPEVLTSVDKMSVNQTLGPLQADKNYYIIKLKARKEPYVPELAAVKDSVKAVITDTKAKEIARERIEKCSQQLQQEHAAKTPVDFEKTAVACGLKALTTEPFTFGSYIKNIGASDEFYTAAESLETDGFSAVIELPTGYYIIKLKERLPVDEKKFQAEKEAFAKQLLAQKKQEAFSRFVVEAKKKALGSP